MVGGDVAGEFDKAREIEVVIFGGILFATFFDFEMLEEIGDEIR